MQKFIIEGGRELRGKVKISGSKNASLPILFGAILTKKATVKNVPDLKDIETTLEILNYLGLRAEKVGDEVKIEGKVKEPFAPYELVKKMRASILALGPLLAKYRKAVVSLPGGCAIGLRPVDLHLKGLRKLGARIEVKHGYVIAEAPEGLKGAEIVLDFPTVGGTENLMMAATMAEGKTVIRNAAREPEIVDLARALKSAGAEIEGEGTDVIEIKGKEELGEMNYKVMPDRIEAGTFLAAVACAGGEIEIEEFPVENLQAVIEKFEEAGLEIMKGERGKVKVKKKDRLKGCDITTAPYPGFPTDMQAQFMAAMCTAEGTSVIKETIFENRFMHALELQRMGAELKIEGNSVIVKGVKELFGAKVMATDLRASASLVVAGLGASGKTEVYRIYHLDRGYERLEEKLRGLGAKIERVKSEINY